MQMKMNKSSKSKIPVLVTKQKSFNHKICNTEKDLEAKKYLLQKQTSEANKIAKKCFIQRKAEKKISLPENSKTLKDDGKNLDFKKKQPSFKGSAKYESISTNKISENSMKSNVKNKFITYKDNEKFNPGNKGIKKTFNVNSNKRTQPSFENKIQSCTPKILDKRKNLPSVKSFPFEMQMPKENQIDFKQDCFSSHENVEFEANEFYRKMILSNKQLSPSMCKLGPNLRISSLQSQRPSIYKKNEISNDPLKDALKALENTSLSVKRVKKENQLPQSPFKERDSIYTPFGDPNQDFLKRLEDFKLKQLQKTSSRSTKKVTFNLNIQECSPKSFSDSQHNLPKNSEHKLVQINERSKETTPNSPQSGKNEKVQTNDVASKDEHILNEILKVDNKNGIEYKEAKAADQKDVTPIGNGRTIINTPLENLLHQGRGFSQQKLKGISCWNSPDFVCDSKKVEYDTCKNGQGVDNMQPTEQKNVKRSAKIYTPKPISLSFKSEMNQNYSPEFLACGKSTIITDLAPICTPLVLRSQAKNVIFSPEADEGPIPLKLDFTEEEKDIPKKETFKIPTLVTPHNIVTYQKKLDYLADQECYLSLLQENFPVICGRYLTNPVAMILNEGDDMHFIPVRL